MNIAYIQKSFFMNCLCPKIMKPLELPTKQARDGAEFYQTFTMETTTITKIT